MYDAKRERHEFVGADRAEAVTKACRFFELPEDQLAIAEFGDADVAGLAARTVVVAVPRDAQERPATSERRGERASPRGNRVGEHGAPRSREDRPRRERPRRERPRERREEQAPPEDLGPSEATRLTDLDGIGEFVAGLVERMEVGPFEIGESDEDEIHVIRVGGAASVRLTGGDGRAVDAIQLLANQAAMRLFDEPPRVVVDVEGDRERREAYLEDLAHRAARRALKTGRAVALDPMNPKSRRVLHVALRNTRDIATMSTGSGRYRQVVVIPRGAPEYEEAVRNAEEAARGED